MSKVEKGSREYLLVNRRPSQASRLISQAVGFLLAFEADTRPWRESVSSNQAAHAQENDGKERMSLYNRDENLRDTISVSTRGEGDPESQMAPYCLPYCPVCSVLTRGYTESRLIHEQARSLNTCQLCNAWDNIKATYKES